MTQQQKPQTERRPDGKDDKPHGTERGAPSSTAETRKDQSTRPAQPRDEVDQADRNQDEKMPGQGQPKQQQNRPGGDNRDAGQRPDQNRPQR